MWFALTFGSLAAGSDGSITGTVSVAGGEDVWIYVKSDDGPQPAAPPTATMRQVGLRFDPTALVVVRGTVVHFPNDGPDRHNVYWMTAESSEDLGTYGVRESRQRTFAEPGLYPIGCNIHPEMAATILVVPNTWVAKVDRQGTYTITGVAPGTYTVEAWSPYAQTTVSKQITVEPAKAARFDAAVR